MITCELAFTIPNGLWLSANDRRHWADKARATKELRLLGKATAQQAKVPPLDRTHVVAHIGYSRGGRADPSNSFPTIKALIDGITDAGTWPDDDSEHVIGPTFRRDPNHGRPRIHTIRLELRPEETQ